MNNFVTFWGQKIGQIAANTVAHSGRFVVQGTTVHTPFLPMIVVSICISLLLSSPAAAGEIEDPGGVTTDPPSLDGATNDLLQIVYAGSPFDGATSIIEVQARYFAEHGRYWQGLPTHSLTPTAGDPLSTDIAMTHPTDQAETWADIGAYLPDLMNVSLRVDVYESPEGHGYVVVAETMITETTWTRSINFGPETWRTATWAPAPFVSPLEP